MKFETCKTCEIQAWYTRTITVTILMSGTFDLSNVMCKEHHINVLIYVLRLLTNKLILI